MVHELVRERVEHDVERASRVELKVACGIGAQRRAPDVASRDVPMRVLTLSLTSLARCIRVASASMLRAVAVECAGPMLDWSSTMSLA